jgi:hypothetical protein
LQDEEPLEKMVCTQVDRSAWDCRLSPNSHALAIYLDFFPIRGATRERFEECQCENNDLCFHYRTWVLDDGHYCCYEAPSTPFPWSIEPNT